MALECILGSDVEAGHKHMKMKCPSLLVWRELRGLSLFVNIFNKKH